MIFYVQTQYRTLVGWTAKEEKVKRRDLLSLFFHKYTQNGLFSYSQGFSSIEYLFSICLDRCSSPIHLTNKEAGGFGVAEI